MYLRLNDKIFALVILDKAVQKICPFNSYTVRKFFDFVRFTQKNSYDQKQIRYCITSSLRTPKEVTRNSCANAMRANCKCYNQVGFPKARQC